MRAEDRFWRRFRHGSESAAEDPDVSCETIPMAALEDFVLFAERHVESCDIDPVYPVLRWLEKGLDEERAMFHVLLYVAYYSVPSSEAAWLGLGERPGVPGEGTLRLPIGTERRGFRDPRALKAHLRDLNRIRLEYGSWTAWLQRDWIGDPIADWDKTREALEEAWGNGRWASYKTAEILARVRGWPIAPADTGADGSSGPRSGLALLYGGEVKGKAGAELAEMRAMALRLALRERYALDLDLAEIETCLCDFHSMVKGRYYVGHDTDAMLEAALNPRVPGDAALRVVEAREATLPVGYRAEARSGPPFTVDKTRNRAYRDAGLILYRDVKTGMTRHEFAEWTEEARRSRAVTLEVES